VTPAILLTLFATPPSAYYLPCTPGHSIEYRLSSGSTVIDTVRGPRQKRPAECVVDRVSMKEGKVTSKDAWVFEVLADRVAEAGWLGATTAFRPPLLVAPLAPAQTWHFNRTDYVVALRGACTVKAGRFADCVTIDARPADREGPRTRSVYAKGVGLVRVEKGGEVREAIRVSEVRRPKKPQSTRR
jgi:hypothetical protein